MFIYSILIKIQKKAFLSKYIIALFKKQITNKTDPSKFYSLYKK